MTVFNTIRAFTDTLHNLPEKNFLRLKAKEKSINETHAADSEYYKSMPHVIKASYADSIIFGDLNSARFHKIKSENRRYYIYAVPHLFISAIYSVIAFPALVFKTAISAAKVLKDSANGQPVDTLPLLNDFNDLKDAIIMSITGIAIGIAKLAASIFHDFYRVYLECQELQNNPEGNTALIVVDAQKTFVEGGNLALPDGSAILQPTVNLMNAVRGKNIVVFTQDWHGPKHFSFAPNVPLPNFSQGEMSGLLNQIFWPSHGIQGTDEAEFLDGLPLNKVNAVIKKGYHNHVDSFSGFYDNGKFNKTSLDEYLKSKNITKLAISGLATDVCVMHTIKHALELNYQVVYVDDASRGTNEENVAKAKKFFEQSNVKIVNSNDLIRDGQLVFPEYNL